jgi:hypothetical protein
MKFRVCLRTDAVCSPKRRSLSELHGITTQKTVPFMEMSFEHYSWLELAPGYKLVFGISSLEPFCCRCVPESYL